MHYVLIKSCSFFQVVLLHDPNDQTDPIIISYHTTLAGAVRKVKYLKVIDSRIVNRKYEQFDNMIDKLFI